MSKQTSLEWLWEKIDNNDAGEIPLWVYDFIEQAKEMHKQEIIDAAERWKGTDFAERYYQEIFGSEGSIEHIVEPTEMIELPQQETLYTEEQVKEAISKSVSILVGQEINLAQLKELTIQLLKN